MKKLLFFIIGFVFILFIPYFVWLFQNETSLNVTIVDNTVPDETYREHQSLPWLLNHLKYKNDDGSPYHAADDYYGFVPDEQEQTHSIRSLPESMEKTDVIYVADSYGVYQEDLPWTDKKTSQETDSSLIYGGLKQEEWERIKNEVVLNQKDLIMEFNTFASPTSADVSNDVSSFLGVEWSGWIGRHFSNLSKESDQVPDWVLSRYEQGKGKWNFTGAGFVLIDENSESVIVLSEDAGSLSDNTMTMIFTDEGKERFGLEESSPYEYWFDILEPKVGTEVLAEYEWNLSSSGEQMLKKADIPLKFPAVLHTTKDKADVFYFAGDFADVASTPSLYQYAGFATVRKLFSWVTKDHHEQFFWSTYTPMMKEIFRDLADKKENQSTGQTVAQATTSETSLAYPAKVSENRMEIFTEGKWVPTTIKGINMGMGKPGYFPGEAAITLEEYERWFKQIGEMNANTIRVYTLHPPAFYEALMRYNQRAEEPIYVLHGVWIDEEPLEETLDAYDKEVSSNFQKEIKKVVDVIHGNAEVKAKRGHASGSYKNDISPYVIGWVIGIEWYPPMAKNMEEKYPDLGEYEGTYIQTVDANPMEHWLAAQLDELTKYEAATYQSIRPLSFTNWVSTDNLDQPAEPIEQEDMASIDPNHIKGKGPVADVGMFASYHVYPYYPDFLNIEEKYTEYIDHRGQKNNYAGYLHDLNASHEMPILIAEFGIPASRGMTHRNPFGRNQGFISEKQQGEMLTRLYEDILQEGMMGGMVFTWQDEWFKRTWNTMDYDNPDRRPYWSNAQTNEQQFGLLSFDRHKVKVDGQTEEWTDQPPLYEKDEGSLRKLVIDHDERYLYLNFEINDLDESFWENHTLQTYFSIRENNGIPLKGDKEFNADFQLTLQGEEATLKVAGDYDPFFYDYGVKRSLFSVTDKEKRTKDSTFHPIRLALNKGMRRPDTGEELPFDYYETGKLKLGIGNPEHEEYDSLADYFYSIDTDSLEIRLPWMLLNSKDPSQREFLGDLEKDGIEASITIDGIDIMTTIESEGQQIDSFTDQPKRYQWDTWDIPKSKERLKKSYTDLQRLFKNTK